MKKPSSLWRLLASAAWIAACGRPSPGASRLSSLSHLLLSPNPHPIPNRTAASHSSITFSCSRFSTAASSGGRISDDSDPEAWDMEWEGEEEVEPQIGDGGDGGGVVLGGVGWGERALTSAQEMLKKEFGADITMFAFKVSPRGYIYVRLDKLTNKYGCPTLEEIEKYNKLYKKRLDEIGERGDIPADLALEVSSPGADRLLKVPEDLDRFKELPMRVQYLEEVIGSKNQQQKDGVFMLESLSNETKHCMWKLADVKENKGEGGKGKPLSRKQKDWRLKLPFESTKRVTIYFD